MGLGLQCLPPCCPAGKALGEGPSGRTSPVLCGPSHQPLLIFGATLNYESANQCQRPGQAPRSKESLLHSKLCRRGPIPPLSPHSRGHIPLPTPPRPPPEILSRTCPERLLQLRSPFLSFLRTIPRISGLSQNHLLRTFIFLSQIQILGQYGDKETESSKNGKVGGAGRL